MSQSGAIVCIGECLWDVLPAGRQPGGAPYNVATYLQRLRQRVQLISRLGNDELGNELLTVLQQQGLDSQLIQRSQTHLTGVVKVNGGDGPRAYKIVEPVAWDYIRHNEQMRVAVSQARMLVYGSLAARRPDTRETLYRLLQVARFKVFDVNLRPPHYTRTVVKYLLRQADLVKFNELELQEIMGWLGQPSTEETALPWLAAHFNLQAVCLTKGAAGVTLWHRHQLFQRGPLSGFEQDVLGSNDAFLAALLTHWDTPDGLQAAALDFARLQAPQTPLPAQPTTTY